MLAGVGGCTVAEAKERLSYEESLAWAKYMDLRGSLHTGMRLEVGFALLAQMINHALGGNASIDDFAPHARRGGSLGEVMAMLGGKR